MRVSKEMLLALALFFLQQTGGVSEWGIDLPLLFVVLVGLRSSVPKAGAWGFVLGTAQDLLSSGWIGPHLVAQTLVGMISSYSQRHVFRERVLTQTFLIFWMALFHQVIIWILLKWDGTAPPAPDAVRIVMGTVAMTTLTGLVVCFFVVRFRHRRYDPATA